MSNNKETQIEINEGYESVTDINIQDLIPNVFDNILVTIFEDHHTINLPMNTTGSQLKTWYKGRGGVFSKDVLKYSLKLPHGQYVLIKQKNLSCVARIITEEEELHFKTLKLIDGQIKDRPYMIFKKVENGSKLSENKKRIHENEIIDEEEVAYIPDTRKIDHHDDDEFEHRTGSISLFTE